MRFDEERIDGKCPLQQADVLLRVAVDDEKPLERVVEALAVGRAELRCEIFLSPQETYPPLLWAPFYHISREGLDVGLLL